MTPDRSMPAPGRADRLDRILQTAVAPEAPPEVLARIDAAIDDRLATWRPRAARPRRRLAVLALAAALVVGGAGGAAGLYAWLLGPFGDLAWSRATPIGLSQTVDGYRVTVDRAYADAASLMLVLSVADERQRPGITQLSTTNTRVTIDAGTYTGLMGASAPDGAFFAVNMVWQQAPNAPLPAGPTAFHVVVPQILVRDDATPPPSDVHDNAWNPWHEVSGPWTFDFELDVEGGTDVRPPEASAEVDGVRVALRRAVIAPAMARLELDIDAGDRGSDWTAIGSLVQGARRLDVMAATFQDGTWVLLTESGAGDASGEWTLEISELVGTGPDGVQIRLEGPWEIDFSVP